MTGLVSWQNQKLDDMFAEDLEQAAKPKAAKKRKQAAVEEEALRGDASAGEDEPDGQ